MAGRKGRLRLRCDVPEERRRLWMVQSREAGVFCMVVRDPFPCAWMIAMEHGCVQWIVGPAGVLVLLFARRQYLRFKASSPALHSASVKASMLSIYECVWLFGKTGRALALGLSHLLPDVLEV